MPWIDMPGGGHAHILCSRGRRSKRCPTCSTGYVEKLCDFPVGNGKTCDAGMCGRCATAIANEVDYCPKHKGQIPAQGALAL
jgi:hypothetical protein